MKANGFIKIFGVDEAKGIVNYRDKHASRTHVYKFNKSCVDKAKLGGGAYLYTESYEEWSVSVDDLKRLVESHELVEKHQGLNGARNVLKLLEESLDMGLYHGIDDVDAITEVPKIKQAIQDVESCQ